MKIALIITTGRTGSDFLQHCLDGINGLIVFSDKFEYHQFFENKSQLKKPKPLIESFLKKYSYLFSNINIENIKINLSIKIFKENFLKLSKDRLINRKEFLILLYKAYYLTSKKKNKITKTIIHHSHGIRNSIKCLEDFPKAKLLITIRHPLSNLRSGLKNWFDFDKSRIAMWHTFFYLYRIRQDLKYLLTKKNKKLFVKLEEANQLRIKKKICKFLSIKFQKNIFNATVLGNPWNGDKLSKKKSRKGRYIKPDGKKEYEKFFSPKEIRLLSYIYKDYKKFGYDLSKVTNFTFLRNLTYIFSFENYILQHKNAKKNVFQNIKYLMLRFIYFIIIFLKLEFLLKNKHLS